MMPVESGTLALMGTEFDPNERRSGEGTVVIDNMLILEQNKESCTSKDNVGDTALANTHVFFGCTKWSVGDR